MWTANISIISPRWTTATSTPTSRNTTAIWLNDCFEVFFKPDEKKGGYYEFEVNPLNTRMELFLPARNTGGWPRFKNETHIEHDTAITVDGTLSGGAKDKDKGWAVEGRIRGQDFAPTGGRPTIGETWKFALCRVNIGMGIDTQELSTYVPCSASPISTGRKITPT